MGKAIDRIILYFLDLFVNRFLDNTLPSLGYSQFVMDVRSTIESYSPPPEVICLTRCYLASILLNHHRIRMIYNKKEGRMEEEGV